MLAGEAIEVSDGTYVDSYGNSKRPYVAMIRGEGQQYRLDRSFLKNKIDAEGAHLPDRNGVYEVRDYPDGGKRTRYYQVMDGAAQLLDTLSDDEVLEAVEASDSNVWADTVAAGATAEASVSAVADTLEVLETIDATEREMVEAFRNGDEEDVGMLMDRIRRVVERL